MTQAQEGSNGTQSSTGAPSTTPALNRSGSTSVKSARKKFHHRFKQLPLDEEILKDYSCALVSDMLWQGHLYITNNYFAFYSNIFGYVTKLLIPIASVTNISKEKTVFIIPIAIGIATDDKKYVFGSFLSRDSAFRFMVETWKTPREIQDPQVHQDDKKDDNDTSENEDDSTDSENDYLEQPSPVKEAPTSNNFSTSILMAVLILSASFLFYRIIYYHSHGSNLSDTSTVRSDNVYGEVFKWQFQEHSQSANKLHDSLNTYVNKIVLVRQSLETLLSLIPSKRKNSADSAEQDTLKHAS